MNNYLIVHRRSYIVHYPVSLLLCYLLTFFQPLTAVSQSVSGVPGYIRVPSAVFCRDGSLVAGVSFLPRRHLAYSKYRSDALAVFASLTFLEFIEVDLRVTRQLDVPKGAHHVVDRVPTVRFRILKEKKYLPAVAAGFHDIVTSFESGEARHFGASYLVATKNFRLAEGGVTVGATAGWGASHFLWRNDEFNGFFGGVSVGSERLPWLKVMADHDGKFFSAGLCATLFHRLTLTAATMNFDSFTGTLGYRLDLLR